jgi:hypothetical protein
MRIYAALYTRIDDPTRPVLLDAWDEAMVEASPSGWRGVVTQEARNGDVAAIAELVLDLPDSVALAVLSTPPPTIPIPIPPSTERPRP